MPNIKKIKLYDSSGQEQIYSIFDEGALRLSVEGKLITGNQIVDKLILDGDFFISEIDDVPVDTAITNVLVQGSSGQIMKRSTDYLLKDIGGVSTSMDDSTGTLTLKLGKQ